MHYRVELQDWSTAMPRALPLRMEVFVQEQGVPAEMEHDEWDALCDHAVAYSGQEVIGTGRLLPDGRIGRMAVRQEWRKRGVGGAILRRLTERAMERGMPSVTLHAQQHAVPFYLKCGFAETGEPFDEAGIPHVAMIRRLERPRG